MPWLEVACYPSHWPDPGSEPRGTTRGGPDPRAPAIPSTLLLHCRPPRPRGRPVLTQSWHKLAPGPPPGRCCEGPSPGGSSSLNPAQTKEPPLGAELPRRLLHKAALWSPGTNASVLGSGFLWQFLSANVVGAPRVWGQGWGPPGSLPSGASLRWPSESLEAAPSSRKGDGCPRDVLASPRGPALPARARGMLSARRPCTPGLSGPPFLPGCNPESFLLFPGSCPTHPVTSTVSGLCSPRRCGLRPPRESAQLSSPRRRRPHAPTRQEGASASVPRPVLLAPPLPRAGF